MSEQGVFASRYSKEKGIPLSFIDAKLLISVLCNFQLHLLM